MREAVSNAKQAQTQQPIATNAPLRKKCEKCEEVGLETWGKIMTYLAAEAKETRDAAQSGWGLSTLMWKAKGTQQLDERVRELEAEEDGVTVRLNKLRSRMLQEEYEEMDRKYARTFVF